MNDREKLSVTSEEFNPAYASARVNMALNKKIEILRTAIIEVIRHFYSNIYSPEKTENEVNERINSSRDFAYAVYHDSMGCSPSAMGQLIGGKIVADLENMLNFLLSTATFDKDENARQFKARIIEYIREN